VDPLGLTCKECNKYSTAIDDKVTIVNKAILPEWVSESFLDSHYTTVTTDEDIILYRVYGGNASDRGAFTSTAPADNRIQVKIDAALLPEWKNTREMEAVILVPKGTTLNIGKVAPQTIASTGTTLEGGADQILMPQDWPEEWITERRKVKA
jgi:hypothetical protein